MKHSEVKYNVKVLKNVLIPMRDGINLAADVYMPDAPGKFPTIMTYHPYSKDGWSKQWTSNESREFVRNGYVYVFLEMRGTGSSEGAILYGYGMQEWEDGYDAVEWISQQPWCDSKVGMWGLSHGGYTTLNVATLNPPHLKAIVPAMCDTNYFDMIYPGGVRHLSLNLPYTRGTGVAFMPPLYTDEEGRWLKVWNYHLEHNGSFLLLPYDHLIEDDFTREGAALYRLDKINVPTYYIGAWRDFFPGPPFVLYNGINAPKKLLMGPWMHGFPDNMPPGPNIDYINELIRWFDCWLKGINNGIMDEPPITIWVEDPSKWHVQNNWPIAGGKWRYENEWPIARRRETVFHLHPKGALESTPYEGKEEFDSFDHKATVGTTRSEETVMGNPRGLALDQRVDEALSLTYTTQPLPKDTEITGAPVLKLYASTSVDVGVFVAKLNDVFPDGSSVAITDGNLNLALRESHDKALPVVPGEVYELTIKLWDTSYLIKAGHRLRLAIASSDFPFLWPTPKVAVNTVYHSQKYPSNIVIPFLPEQKFALTEPTLHEVVPPSHLPPILEYYKPYRRIERDIGLDPAQSTVTVYLGYEDKYILSSETTLENICHFKATTSDIAPADTRLIVVTCCNIVGHKLGKVSIKVNAIETLKTLYATINIVVNDLLVFSKTWSRP
jgi:putative CocE/NonD family hydrolase